MTDAAAAWSSAALPGRRVGAAVEFHEALTSTNDRARQALRNEGREGVAVVADAQTQGRGRRGRTWLSPPGTNLALSVAIRPSLPAERAGLLGIAAALATRDACAISVAQPLRVRWPNDIVTADGLKVSGILVETALAGEGLAEAVIGVGVNVNWRRSQMPQEIAGRATSLADLLGADLDRVAVLTRLLERLDAELLALEAGASPVARFREVSALDGRHVTLDIGSGLLEGRVLGIADDGSLELATREGPLALAVGEVVAVRDTAALAAAGNGAPA
jgi:BirA family biotin operon repressor/biotin-[acetyl-CoA-carboxylase] ligase